MFLFSIIQFSYYPKTASAASTYSVCGRRMMWLISAFPTTHDILDTWRIISYHIISPTSWYIWYLTYHVIKSPSCFESITHVYTFPAKKSDLLGPTMWCWRENRIVSYFQFGLKVCSKNQLTHFFILWRQTRDCKTPKGNFNPS